MKRILSISKGLQDSGQPAVVIGHFSIQTGNFEWVTNVDNVHEQPKTALSETDAGKNTNRYTTEHDRNNVDACHPVSVELTPDLLEVIKVWQNLPDSIRLGIVAMVNAIFSSPKSDN